MWIGNNPKKGYDTPYHTQGIRTMIYPYRRKRDIPYFKFDLLIKLAKGNNFSNLKRSSSFFFLSLH